MLNSKSFETTTYDCTNQKTNAVILYNVKEVSKILKTNTDYVYSLIKSKLLPALKIGSYKIRAEALEDFLTKYEGYDLTDPFNIVKLD